MGTRDAREALRVARALAFAAKELFARLEANLSRPPTVEEIANAAAARELKTTNTLDLGGGRSLSYSLETSSNDPAEIVSKPQPRLAILPREALAAHAPADSGCGRWEMFEMPFAAFAALFQPVAV